MLNRKSNQRSIHNRELIKSKLNGAGIKVYSGKRMPEKGKYSGIIGDSNKVLEFKI